MSAERRQANIDRYKEAAEAKRAARRARNHDDDFIVADRDRIDDDVTLGAVRRTGARGILFRKR